eukprot:5407083-Amphidinium_carterae.1
MIIQLALPHDGNTQKALFVPFLAERSVRLNALLLSPVVAFSSLSAGLSCLCRSSHEKVRLNPEAVSYTHLRAHETEADL